MNQNDAINAARLYAERFTPEWMNAQDDCWIYDATDWFFENYLKKVDSGYTKLNGWFKEEIFHLWHEKENEYFGKRNDYYDLRYIESLLKDSVSPVLRKVFGRGNFDIKKSLLGDVNNAIEEIRKLTYEYEQEHEQQKEDAC